MMIKEVLLGAIAMAALTISLIFARHWHQTRDRLFLLFAAAFAVMGIGRVAFAVAPNASDHSPVFYCTQLFAFMIIISAIVDKNRSSL